MKSSIENIILSFTKQEYRDFKYFVSSSKDTSRRDISLLEMIRLKKDAEEKNVNAHHQTKKRLKQKLERFTLNKSQQQDGFSKIYALMETAKYLFRKNMYDEGWNYLLNAEKMAIDAEEYRLLDYNYDIQIAYSYNVAAHPKQGFSIEMLLKKWEENKILSNLESNANAAYALLVNELNKQFAGQLSVNIDTLINDILERYKIDKVVYDNKFRIYCKIVSLICRVLREKREYENLKRYSINSYKTIEENKAIDKVPQDFLIDLLDAICIATLRSKDYRSCEKYTGLYEKLTQQMIASSPKYTYYDFIQSVGVCDLSLCTNKLHIARQCMIAAKEKYGRYTSSVRISFLLRINLIAVHFCYGEYGECIKLYNEIKRLNEKKILAEPGFRLELVLFSDLYAIIFHYEERDEEFATYLLDKFKRKYASILSGNDLQREKRFIDLLEKILKKSTVVKQETYVSKVRQFISMRTYIPGDFEYISMNAWLQSKISGSRYYDCLLEIVE
jgi:hypothetical protein